MDLRKNYYSFLGVQSTVRPSIENSLSSESLDLQRLKLLVLWIKISHNYRTLIWKLILGVLPLEKNCWELVSASKSEEYDMILETTGILYEQQSEVDSLGLARMVVVHHCRNPLNLLQDIPEHLIFIAAAFLDICDVYEQDAFWLMTKFVKYLNISFQPGVELEALSSLHEMMTLVQPELAHHLKSIGNYQDKISLWLSCCFSSVLDSKSLEVVWDIVLGGAKELFINLALSLLTFSKKRLLECKNEEQLGHVLTNIRQYVDIRAVTNAAVEAWEKPIISKMPKEAQIALLNH
jgi:hypothetical protein